MSWLPICKTDYFIHQIPTFTTVKMHVNTSTCSSHFAQTTEQPRPMVTSFRCCMETRLNNNSNNLKLHEVGNECWFTIATSRSTAMTHFSSFGRPLSQKLAIDNYAKDGGPGEAWFLCGFYHEPLRIWNKTNVNNFAFWSRTTLKLRI